MKPNARTMFAALATTLLLLTSCGGGTDDETTARIEALEAELEAERNEPTPTPEPTAAPDPTATPVPEPTPTPSGPTIEQIYAQASIGVDQVLPPRPSQVPSLAGQINYTVDLTAINAERKAVVVSYVIDWPAGISLNEKTSVEESLAKAFFADPSTIGVINEQFLFMLPEQDQASGFITEGLTAEYYCSVTDMSAGRGDQCVN